MLVPTRQDADGAHLEISNSGDEVDLEAIPALFEPFRRVQADRTGSTSDAGLGLPIVPSIAASHEGQVHATARPDGGLVVEAVLPARPAASDETA